ncbi:MAG TPA: polymer-forming cytoskeletal protein [Gemmatimonadales bacterium]|nr:polymer-forming cytoskeletal protein [Gemmatimonadales bacterium]
MSLFNGSAPARDENGNELRRRRSDQVPFSIIAKDMTIVGDLETEGLVRIEGKVRGTVRAGGQVLLGQGAHIEGDVHTREAVIGGDVVGSIHASERVELQATASVTGNIATPRISVLEGGRVSGEVRIQDTAAQVLETVGAR